MRGADGVNAHLLQEGNLSSQSHFVNGSPEAAQIMVLTGTMDFNMPPIQEEASLTIEFHRPKTEGLRFLINHRIIDHKLGSK
ncbi:hypothetical protein D3C76_1485780 [compost metagenome]